MYRQSLRSGGKSKLIRQRTPSDESPLKPPFFDIIDPKRTSPPCGGNATHTLLLRLTVSFPTYRFCARDSVTREGEQDWGR